MCLETYMALALSQLFLHGRTWTRLTVLIEGNNILLFRFTNFLPLTFVLIANAGE